MSAFGAALEERVRSGDVTQVATLVLAALVVTLVTVWPSTVGASNESWYAFSQARAVILALLAIGFGATAVAEAPRRSAATAVVVVVLALLAIPLELASFAATYPATPVWWPLLTIAVAPAGYFAVGLLLGRAARAVRLGAFLPLLVPAVVVGMLVLDIRLGWTVVNPLTAALAVSPPFAVASSALAVATVVWATRRWRAGADDGAS